MVKMKELIIVLIAMLLFSLGTSDKKKTIRQIGDITEKKLVDTIASESEDVKLRHHIKQGIKRIDIQSKPGRFKKFLVIYLLQRRKT